MTGTCESIARELREQGVGAQVKHAEVITPEEENALWDAGVMGIFSPRALVRAVFFYVGKAFCLRGGTEQRSLKPSQFVREHDPARYTYTENGSKNHKGGFGTLRNSNKVVTVYSTGGDPLHDVVYLLDTYFKKFPQPPSTLDFFYLQPRAKVPEDPTAPWFHPNPMGKNNLNSLISQMCQEAGIKGRKTNYSLRATGATALFNAQVPEKMIKEVTGHRSSKALALYERPSLAQKQALSKVAAEGGNFDEQVQAIEKQGSKSTGSKCSVSVTHSHSAK